MIVVDSSAIVAIAFSEPRAAVIVERLLREPAGQRLVSAANYVETGTVLAGRRHDNAGAAIDDLRDLLTTLGIRIVAVDEAQAVLALNARIRFGRGFGKPAGLNFGDAFAYALAKALDAPLLFVGDDFAATDIRDATTV